MNKKRLISSLLTIALCVSMIAGSTFALFTSKDTIDVSVKAAKVNIEATISDITLSSMGADMGADAAVGGTFENGGTATYDAQTGAFTLTNIAPGDKVNFKVNIINNSNIKIQYRVTEIIKGDLVDALVAKVDDVELVSNSSTWTLWDIPTEATKTVSHNVSIELPVDVNDDYQEKTASVTFIVEAVQSNGTDLYVSEVNSPDALAAALLAGEDIVLTEDVVLDEGTVLEIAAGSEVVIDLNGKTLTGAVEKSAGALISNEGLLTVKGGTLKNTTVNGGAVINNTGSLVLDGATIVGAPIGDGNYPSYAVTTGGNLVIEEGTSISSDRGAIQIKGNGTTTINGGTFTNNDIDRSLTSHVVDLADDVTGVHTLTINGGTFQHLHDETSGGVVICNRTTNTVYVNGGSFSGGNYYGNDNLSDYGFHGTFAVTGGTYTAKPADAYIAAGCEAVTNTDGTFSVVVSGQDGFAVALESNAQTVTLAAGTFTLPNEIKNKTVTISGTEDTKISVTSGLNYINGSNVTFDGVTIQSDPEGAGYTNGFADGQYAVFNNCVINGTLGLDYSCEFNNCEFNVSGNFYNIWTWGAGTATFNECTFNCDGKALLVYANITDNIDNQYHQTVVITDCTFNDNGDDTVTGKAAIEISNTYTPIRTYDVFINGTSVNGFAQTVPGADDFNAAFGSVEGSNIGTNVWGNKCKLPSTQLNVVIDGVDVH